LEQEQITGMDLKTTNRTSLETPLLAFLAMLFGVVLLRSAWITEDAYITLRTVANFINGYGLTWNIAERVQAYTHPLWMLALSALYFFTHEAFYTTLVLSLACSLGAFILVAKMAPRLNLATIAGLCVLLFSKAFIDFSTSGLENPATHLLLAAFLLIFLGQEGSFEAKKIFWLSFLAGLATLNRMDTALFFAPAIIYILIRQRSWSTLKWMLIGFLPFILWELFSILYYGFPFPNTAYAKLGNDLSRIDLLEMGYLYFMNSLHWDPISLPIIGTAMWLAFTSGSWREKTVSLGVGLYLLYVLWIGADYMSGRFFSAALLVAVVLFNRRFSSVSLAGGIIVLAFVFTFGFISPTPTLTSIDDASFSTGRTDINGIADERSFYYQPSSLLYDKAKTIEPYHDWVFKGLQLKADGTRVQPLLNIGFTGYFAGPSVYIIDRLALADPLLAHLPPIPKTTVVMGHFERAIPDGYFQSVKYNENRLTDPNLALYYDKIRLLTRAPLFSWDRLAAIWFMNTGQYDYLLKSYKP
jgi:arabinofuranosyltransferase